MAGQTASTPSAVRRPRRIGGWLIVAAGGILAWTLMMLAAVWQGGFLTLFFPAMWCGAVALRQFRMLQTGA